MTSLLRREARPPGLNPERQGIGGDRATGGRGGGKEEAPSLKQIQSPPHPSGGQRSLRSHGLRTGPVTAFCEGLDVNLSEALRGFPGGSVNPPATAGDSSLISGRGRSPFLGATKPAGATAEPVLLSACIWSLCSRREEPRQGEPARLQEERPHSSQPAERLHSDRDPAMYSGQNKYMKLYIYGAELRKWPGTD